MYNNLILIFNVVWTRNAETNNILCTNRYTRHNMTNIWKSIKKLIFIKPLKFIMSKKNLSNKHL